VVVQLVNAQGPSVLTAHMVSVYKTLPFASMPEYAQFLHTSVASLLSVSQRVADDSHYYTDTVQQLAEMFE
jgi:hypothetical protein